MRTLAIAATMVLAGLSQPGFASVGIYRFTGTVVSGSESGFISEPPPFGTPLSSGIGPDGAYNVPVSARAFLSKSR